MSPEELEAFIQMQDFGGQEKQLAQQQLTAAMLRKEGMQPSSGRHWTRQAARGLQGIGAAMGDIENRKAQEALGQQKKTWIGGMAERAAAARAAAGGGQGAADYGAADPSNFMQGQNPTAPTRTVRKPINYAEIDPDNLMGGSNY